MFGHGFLSGAELGILTLVGTPEVLFLYQWRVIDRFVHQKSLSCTNGVSWTGLVHQKSLSCTSGVLKSVWYPQRPAVRFLAYEIRWPHALPGVKNWVHLKRHTLDSEGIALLSVNIFAHLGLWTYYMIYGAIELYHIGADLRNRCMPFY